ncbi:MAG: YfhO family protein [Candidatus Scalinduaceae bacterium]
MSMRINKLSIIEDKCPNFWVMVILFLLQLMLLWRMIFLNQFPLDWDLMGQIYPWRVISAKMIKDGIIPLWNPYILSGTPLLADMLSGVFYPLNLLFLILTPFTAMKLNYFIHYFLMGIFTYFFCISIKMDRFGGLIAATIFPFSLYVFSRETLATNTTVLASITWLPLLFMLVERLLAKNRLTISMLLGVVLALQFLAGHPQIAYYSTLSLILYLVFRCYSEKREWRKILKSCFLLAFALFLGVFLSAVQILPTIEFTTLSYRGWNQDVLGGLGPSDFFRLGGVYVGIVPLILILPLLIFQRNMYAFFFFALIIISFLVMVEFTHFSSLLSRIIPFFRTFYGANRVIFLYIFSVSILAGIGVNTLIENFDTEKKDYLAKLCKFMAFFSILLVFVLVFAYWGREVIFSLSLKVISNITSSAETSEKLYKIHSSFISLMWFSLSVIILSMALVFLRLRNKFGNHLFMAGILLLVLAVLLIQEKPTNVDLRVYFEKTEATKFLKNHNKYQRIDAIDPKYVIDRPQLNFFVPNINSIHNIYGIRGYTPLHMSYYLEFIDLINGAGVDSSLYRSGEKKRFLWVDNFKSKLVDLLNVRYIVTSKGIKDPQFNLVYADDIKIYENKNVLERAFMVYDYKVIKDKQGILSELGSDDFNPRKVVILEREPQKVLKNEGDLSVSQLDSVDIITYLPNEVVIQTESDRGGFLVLGDTYYPGWKVFVDRNEDVIYKANYILRGVYLDEGSHTIKFIYDPISFKLGWIVSLTTLVGISLFFLCCIWPLRLER